MKFNKMVKELITCLLTMVMSFSSISYGYTKNAFPKSNLPIRHLNVSENESNTNDLFKINETVEKKISVQTKTKVKIYSFEGEITVKSEKTSVVKVRANKLAIDKEASDNVEYTFAENAGEINLQANFIKPDRKVTYGKHSFYMKGAYVNWEVIVPLETDLILETGEGKIIVSDVTGTINLSNQDGNIIVDKCKGQLNSTTFDGKVQIIGYQGNADVNNRGDKQLLLEGDFQNLSVESGGGSVLINVNDSNGGVVETDAKNFTVKNVALRRSGSSDDNWQTYTFGTGNSKYKIKSNNGKVLIYSN